MSGQESRARTRVRRGLQVTGALLIAWMLASAVMLNAARSRAIDGLNLLEQAKNQIDGPSLLRGDGERVLASALRDFEQAHDRASSSVLTPWSVVPLVGQNTRSVDALTKAAVKVARVGQQVARASSRAMRSSPTTGAERIALLHELQTVTEKASRQLSRVDLGPDFFLVGPVGDARTTFLRRLNILRKALADARAVTRGAQQLLTGPRRYLLIAANNAEMRAGSGMLLTVGVASFANGDFTISDMQPTANFNLPPGAVALPPELAQLWGWTKPGEEWRNLATSPRFDVTGPLAAEMWRTATGQDVDGVLVVDPVTLAALLRAQGPVDVDGLHATGANVVQLLLLDQYQGLGTGDSQSARRDQLSDVARAAVDTLNTRPWKGPDLVGQLSSVGRGRHVLAWSRDPVEERSWRAAGIDGRLRGSSLAVSLLNVGANKLDQFMHLDATLHVRETGDGGHEVRVAVRIRNDAPTGLPGYVAGPDPRTDLVEGQYQGILAVNVPGAASLPTTDAPEGALVAGVDGPTKVVGTGYLRIARGEVRTVTVAFKLPAGVSGLRVEPSARVPAVTWHNGSRTWNDTKAERQEW